MKDIYGAQTLESMGEAIWYNKWTLEKFSKYLKGDILEVGCGIGNFTKILVRYGKVTAIDIADDYIEETQSKVNSSVSVGLGNIETGKVFFGDKKFDCVVCINVLEHIKNDNAALENLTNYLKPGGRLILLVPSHQFLYTAIDKALNHFRRYDKNQLKKRISERGIQVVALSRLNFIGAIGWFVAGKILGNTIIEKNKIRLFNILAPFFLKAEDTFGAPIGTSVLLIGEKNK